MRKHIRLGYLYHCYLTWCCSCNSKLDSWALFWAPSELSIIQQVHFESLRYFERYSSKYSTFSIHRFSVAEQKGAIFDTSVIWREQAESVLQFSDDKDCPCKWEQDHNLSILPVAWENDLSVRSDSSPFFISDPKNTLQSLHLIADRKLSISWSVLASLSTFSTASRSAGSKSLTNARPASPGGLSGSSPKIPSTHKNSASAIPLQFYLTHHQEFLGAFCLPPVRCLPFEKMVSCSS